MKGVLKHQAEKPNEILKTTPHQHPKASCTEPTSTVHSVTVYLINKQGSNQTSPTMLHAMLHRCSREQKQEIMRSTREHFCVFMPLLCSRKSSFAGIEFRICATYGKQQQKHWVLIFLCNTTLTRIGSRETSPFFSFTFSTALNMNEVKPKCVHFYACALFLNNDERGSATTLLEL